MQQEPYRHAKRAGEMRHHRIDGDDKVELGNDRRGLCDRVRRQFRGDRRPLRRRPPVFVSRPALQGDERYARDVRQWRELARLERPLWPPIARRPTQPNLGMARERCEPMFRSGDCRLPRP